MNVLKGGTMKWIEANIIQTYPEPISVWSNDDNNCRLINLPHSDPLYCVPAAQTTNTTRITLKTFTCIRSHTISSQLIKESSHIPHYFYWQFSPRIPWQSVSWFLICKPPRRSNFISLLMQFKLKTGDKEHSLFSLRKCLAFVDNKEPPWCCEYPSNRLLMAGSIVKKLHRTSK